MVSRETLRKSLLYLKGAETYWKLAPAHCRIIDRARPIGLYPLDLVLRLNTGHFATFDTEGIPHIVTRTGVKIQNYTTKSAYALAHWNLYATSGLEIYVKPLLNIAAHIMATADRTDGEIRLRSGSAAAGHTGRISAMVQGEAMSVLCRAFLITRRVDYLDAAIACIPPFERTIEEGGIVAHISTLGVPWFEEDTVPPIRHILNGMIYSLWGLHDVATVAHHRTASRLYDAGLKSVSQAIALFDKGWWSSYDFPERGESYIASMMYHNLHICQLTWLGNTAGIPSLLQAAERFRSYAANPVYRLRAAVKMFAAKAFGHPAYR